jgi:hypothetical protein
MMGLKDLFSKRSEEAPAAAAPPAPAAAPAAGASGADESLIAVIAAAIAAFEGTAAASSLVVRKIVRIPGPDFAWSNTGRHEALDSRRV